MIHHLWLDLETYSATPIKDGTYRYAENSEIMLFLYAIDDGPAQCWDRTTLEPMPVDLISALADEDCIIHGHNSMFDRTVMNYNGFETTLTRWRDTLVQAYEHSLPGALGKLGQVMNARMLARAFIT